MEKNIRDDASLIKKSLLEELNENEERELERLLENEQMNAVREQLSDPTFLKEQFAQYDKYSAKKGFRFFQEKRRKGKRKQIIRRGIAIAACWIFIVGIIFWMKNEESKDSDSLPVASNIIPAGGKQARLILGDGSVVEIAKKDLRISQKEGEQVKYENGKLMYDVKGAAGKQEYHSLEVPHGGECFVTLSDGTEVWVNAGSTLRYPKVFGDTCREVFLEGEAYFDVKQDGRKFVVKTDWGNVRVLGTAFGVSAYEGEEKCYTTLVHGKVSFQTSGRVPLEIAPGEQVVVDKSGDMLKRMVDTNEYVGWRNALYVFKNRKLEDVMKTLERWYDISVFYQDTSLREITFTGDLKRYDSITVFLKALTRTGELNYKVEGRTVILYK